MSRTTYGFAAEPGGDYFVMFVLDDAFGAAVVFVDGTLAVDEGF